jgi:DNA end-binding protein Ku
MAPRATWKGYLKLSLVSCAVALYPASTTTERVRFNTLNRKTGNRVKRQFIDSETEEVVPSEDQVKGYPVGRGEYILVEDQELDDVALESTHTIAIESFAPRSSVDERYLDSPYYVAPEGRVAEEAFAVIREAMRKKKMVGVARVVLQRRERILMIEPFDKGLLATSLRYAPEVRQAEPYFEEIPDLKLDDDMIDLASDIIARKTAPFDPKRFNDRYEDALLELIKSKQTGKTVKPAPAAKPSNVVNLMDALRRSLSSEERPSKEKAGAANENAAAPAKKRAAAVGVKKDSKRTAPSRKRAT